MYYWKWRCKVHQEPEHRLIDSLVKRTRNIGYTLLLFMLERIVFRSEVQTKLTEYSAFKTKMPCSLVICVCTRSCSNMNMLTLFKSKCIYSGVITITCIDILDNCLSIFCTNCTTVILLVTYTATLWFLVPVYINVSYYDKHTAETKYIVIIYI